MKKRLLALVLAGMMAVSMAGCGSTETAEAPAEETAETAGATEAVAEETAEPTEEAAEEVSSNEAEVSPADGTEVLAPAEITVFAAKSLNSVLDELITVYNESQPDVKVTASYDSSGTLLTQIEEGAACDVFFSAAQKQMNTLEQDDNMVVEGTRENVVNNQVCVVTYKGSNTAVTGLDDMDKASSLAIADGSVPVGKYTRQALVNMGKLAETEDVSTITTQEISDAFGGVEINECANVGAVAAAVSEGSNEVGTVYYSDTFGYEDKLEILEQVSYDLTGDVIYPAAQVVNAEADDAENAAAVDFVKFLKSDAAKEVFEKYHFDTNVD